MLPEIWEPDQKVVFVGAVIAEPSNTLGFPHLHPRDRFWELLEINAITPTRVITKPEVKALTEGQAKGNLSDPIRSMFFQKKTSQLLRLGIGLTDVNRRVVAPNEKDTSALPTQEDIDEFIVRCERFNPRTLAFVISPEIFVELFMGRYPDTCNTLGIQPWKICNAEVWLLGSTSVSLRGEALNKQEDAFFALGERLESVR
jgi:G:T/U-mismatch repair DNA glycosylase